MKKSELRKIIRETIVVEGFKSPLTEQYSHMYHIEWTGCDGSINPHCTNHSVNQGGPCLGLATSAAICPATGPCNPSTALTPYVGMNVGGFSAGSNAYTISYFSGPHSGGGGSMMRKHNVDSPMCSTSGCDNSMAGSCAQQWLPSNMNWPNMTNFACTGNQTYSSVEQNQLNQATNLLNQNGVTNIPSFNNYQDISNFVNGTGIGQPQKGQIKRKLAKSYWGGCMFNECNC